MRQFILLSLIALLAACAATPNEPAKRKSRAPDEVVNASLSERLLTEGEAYINYAEAMPTSHYFEILKPLDCDHWFWLTEIRHASQIDGNKQYYLKRRPWTESSWAAQCFKKMHKILRDTDDPVLKVADGVIFDYKQFRIKNRGTPIIGYHHVFMPGWAIRFKEPSAAEVLAVLKRVPLTVLETRQLEAAAKIGGRMRLPEAVPHLLKVVEPFLKLQVGLRDNPTTTAALEGLARMPVGSVDLEMWWRLLEGGERTDRLRPNQHPATLYDANVGAATVVASRALYCANPPDLFKRMSEVFLRSMELDRKTAAAMTLAAVDRPKYNNLQRGVAGGRFDMRGSEWHFKPSDCQVENSP